MHNIKQLNFQTILSNMLASECVGDHILFVLKWWICIQFLTDRSQHVLYPYICSGLSGKYQILVLGGDYVLGSWSILEPICLKAAGGTEHLGAFPSVQRQIALSLRLSIQAVQPPRGLLPFAGPQSWSYLPDWQCGVDFITVPLCSRVEHCPRSHEHFLV